MNVGHSVLATLLLWLTATGLGLLLLSRVDGVGRRGCVIPCAAGLCAAAATLPSLFALGLPRSVVLGFAYVAAIAGWLLRGRAALGSIDRWGVLGAISTLIVFMAPGATALSSPPLFHDATMVWWPKFVEVTGGDAGYFGATTFDHAVPSYPRGLAWLCTIGVPLGPPTQQVMMCVTWLCSWTTALLLVRAARDWLRFGDALAIAVIYGLLPDVAELAGSGQADPAIAMAALLAAIGLTRRYHGDGALLAAIAGVGAFSIKVEGGVVLSVVGAYFLLDLVRHSRWRARTLLALALTLVVVPGTLARSGQPATRMDVLPTLLAQPDLLFTRGISAVEHFGASLWSAAPHEASGTDASVTCWTGVLVLLCLGVLARWWRRTQLVACAAWALLPAALAVYVTTGVSVRWHATTTVPRLMAEVAPTCLLAAAIVLRAGTATWSAAPACDALAGAGVAPQREAAGAS